MYAFFAALLSFCMCVCVCGFYSAFNNANSPIHIEIKCNKNLIFTTTTKNRVDKEKTRANLRKLIMRVLFVVWKMIFRETTVNKIIFR